MRRVFRPTCDTLCSCNVCGVRVATCRWLPGVSDNPGCIVQVKVSKHSKAADWTCSMPTRGRPLVRSRRGGGTSASSGMQRYATADSGKRRQAAACSGRQRQPGYHVRFDCHSHSCDHPGQAGNGLVANLKFKVQVPGWMPDLTPGCGTGAATPGSSGLSGLLGLGLSGPSVTAPRSAVPALALPDSRYRMPRSG